MSRKDYKVIGNIIAGEVASHPAKSEGRRVAVNIALSLSDVFKQDNPRFDRTLFYLACGMNPEDAPHSWGS